MRGEGSFDEFVARISVVVGAENIVLTTDLGQVGNVHVDELRTIVQRLAGAGFSQAEIDMMTKHNPARLLGLD